MLSDRLYHNVGNLDPPAVPMEGLTLGCKLLARIKMKGEEGSQMNVKEFSKKFSGSWWRLLRARENFFHVILKQVCDVLGWIWLM